MKYDLIAMFTDIGFFYGLACAFVVFIIWKKNIYHSIESAIFISMWAIASLYFFAKWESKDFLKSKNG